MTKYLVTNLGKDERKFRDKSGRDIFVLPGKSVITTTKLAESDIWGVQIHTEETEETKIKKEVTSRKMKTKKMLGDN